MYWENKKKSCDLLFAIFAILQWSGTNPAISLRYACNFNPSQTLPNLFYKASITLIPEPDSMPQVKNLIGQYL